MNLQADLLVLLPELIVAVGAMALLIGGVIAGDRATGVVSWLAVLLLTAAAAITFGRTAPASAFHGAFVVDGFARFAKLLVLIGSAFCVLMAQEFFAAERTARFELPVLMLLATLGMMLMVSASSFIALYMGLELQSLALYVLASFNRDSLRSTEAGLKYFVLGALSSGMLLYGISLIYGFTGTTEFRGIATAAAAGGIQIGLIFGLVFLVAGLAFKVGAVPFHMWTPDVYEGAPAPVTAFIATVSKGGMFALLLRYFSRLGLHYSGSLFLIFAIIAIVSMLVGNLLALLQTNVKRILAYSSIAHLGYLLVAFLAGGSTGTAAVTYYLVAYFVTMLGAFGVVTVLSVEKEADAMVDYEGLFWQRPWLAVVFAASLLSLAGIPLTAGFVGKFYVIAAGVGSSLWSLVLILVVSSGIGLFYYLRIVVAMYKDAPREGRITTPSLSLTGSVALATLTLLLFWLGIYPVTLIHTVQWCIANFSN